MNTRSCYVVVIASTMLSCSLGFAREAPESTAAKTWTSRDGKHTTEAAYAGFQMGKVVLRKADGATVAVPIIQLSEADQEYVAEIAEDDAEAVEGLATREVDLKRNDAGRVIEAVFPRRMRVGRQEIALLSGLPNLQRLVLIEARVGEGAFDEIKQLYNLRQLDLTSTLIGNTEVKKLADLKKLESLDISDTRITNRAISYLKELPRLRELALANTRIGDEGIAHLEEVKTLERLNLSNVRISPQGILRLRKALPNTAMEGSGVIRR